MSDSTSQAAPPAPDPSPDFIREAWREVVSFIETTLAVIARPGAWRAGRAAAVGSQYDNVAWLFLVVQFVWLTRALLAVITDKASLRSVRVVTEAVLSPVWVVGSLVGGIVLLLPVAMLAAYLAGIVDGRREEEWNARARRALLRPGAQASWDRGHTERVDLGKWRSGPSREQADAAARRSLTKPGAQAEWDRPANLPRAPAAPPGAAPPPAARATAQARPAEAEAPPAQGAVESFMSGLSQGLESGKAARRQMAPASSPATALPATAPPASALATGAPTAQATSTSR